jgi:hypothetical protein
MHLLRKLTDCLSSTARDNDESSKHEENTSSTTNTLSRVSPIEDITIKKTIINKVDSILEPRDIRQTIMLNER